MVEEQQQLLSVGETVCDRSLHLGRSPSHQGPGLPSTPEYGHFRQLDPWNCLVLIAVSPILLCLLASSIT